jgi:tetratricopeptide (TPR) repeat protein
MKQTLYLVCTFTAALALAGPWAFLTYARPFPPADKISEVRQSAVEDALALTLGLRRLAADLWFIRLMQYYGAPDLEEHDSPDGKKSDPGHGHPGHHCDLDHFGEGKYPDFLPIARHILMLDPYFVNAGLYAAGSLAFNMSRPDEAISLLNGALVYRPREWKYVKLLAAIGYSKARNPEKVSEYIAPLLLEPDCPVMIRQQAAFLNKKAGNYRAAYQIYKTILETTKDRFYIDNAGKEILKLKKMKGFNSTSH